MPKAKVTIITASYNKPQFVSQSILSVLNQTFKNFEYIIVDNSTDAQTRKRIKTFLKDKRIRYFEEKFSTKTRRKFYIPALILNKYYQIAKGDYIFFLADDDLLFPGCLEKMLAFFKSHPGSFACYHDQSILYAFKQKPSFEPLVRGFNAILKYPNYNPKDLLDGGQVMFSKKILKLISKPYLPIGWDTANICDKIFLEKVWKQFPIYPTHEVLSIKRVVPSSTFKNHSPLAFNFYYWGTKFIPLKIQNFFGTLTKKRRILSTDEKIKLNKKWDRLNSVLTRGLMNLVLMNLFHLY